MANCDPAALAEQAKCIDQCIPAGMRMSVLILLAAQIAGVSTDPATLAENAKCIDHCIPEGEKLAVLISLTCQLIP